METLVLTSRVVQEADKFVARIEGLGLEGEGNSMQEAQDALVYQMRAWIELHDGTSNLERILAEAGYPGVEETTELQLEFVE